MVKGLDEINPEFYLQPGEVVIYTLKARKLGISYILAFILTIVTLGVFLFFQTAFKRVKSYQVIVLTNKRVLMYEHKLSGCFGYDPRIIDQKWFPISDLSYYQHEFVQDKAIFFGLCKQEAFTTLRLFFSQYPDGVPPSYNNALAFKPVTGGLIGVATKAGSAIAAGIAGNYVSMAKNIIQFVYKLVKLLLSIFLRKEIKLPGHYIEMDTADEGSFEKINELLTHLMAAYPIRNVVTAPPNAAAVEKVDNDAPLFGSVEDSVKLVPRYIQFAPEENIVDAVPHPMRFQLMDWILAVCTLSLYYFLVMKDMKKYKGALIITDRRFISLFTHNQHGLQDNGVKYVQSANCWFLKDITHSLVYTTNSPSCLTTMCIPLEHEFFVDCGPGMLSIHPERANSTERKLAFFAKFFHNGNSSKPYTSHKALDGASAEIPVRIADILRLPGEEEIGSIVRQEPRKNCCFSVQRLCSMGCAPPEFDHSITATTHRLQVKFSVSNGCTPNFIQYELLSPLKYLNGFGLHEIKPFCDLEACCCCDCYYVTNLGVSLRNDFRFGDSNWTLYLPMRYTKMNEYKVQSFVQGLGVAQNSVEEYVEKSIEIFVEGGRV